MPALDPQKLDLNKVAVIVTLASIFAAGVTTWALMQYRIGIVEERLKTLESRLEEVDRANVQRAEDIKCLICEANKIPCPGC